MRAGSLLPLTITMNLNINSFEIDLTASECPHPGAVKRIHSTSVPQNWATLAQWLPLQESTFATVLCTSVRIVRWMMLQIIMTIMVKWRGRLRGARGQRTGNYSLIWSGLITNLMSFLYVNHSSGIGVVLREEQKGIVWSSQLLSQSDFRGPT